MATPLADVRAAVDKKDPKGFEQAYDTLTKACNDCHQATNFGFNLVQRPMTNRMQGVAQSQAAWLQKKVTQFPSGTNTILVTHQPNMAGAFPQLTAGLADGEALIFGSDGKGGAALVARVKIEEWPRMQH